MIDHLLGRPSVSWKRTQVFLVLFFWGGIISNGPSSPGGPRILAKLNRYLKRFSPWQIILSTLTIVYGTRNLDSILGLSAPEPLARLYSRSYYRATWVNVALEAGFATAMNIKPKWLRDICSILFSVYYLIYAHEADEKLRKYRATCTVETLRITWEKLNNPYLRLFSYLERPSLPVARQILLPRPANSKHRKPITGWLFWARPEPELETATDLILDIPGGGFVSLGPRHHEERLRRWALVTRRPVLSIDYGKAPEYPFPWAIEECFDVYRILVESQGAAIGMSGKLFNVIMTGDSAGANIICGVMFKILENPRPIQHPCALVLNYACLDFNFGSWMTPANLRVLKAEASSENLAGVEEQKAHIEHRSPLAVVRDVSERRVKRRKSWGRLSLTGLAPRLSASSMDESETPTRTFAKRPPITRAKTGPHRSLAGDEADDEFYPMEEHEKPIAERALYTAESVRQKQSELEVVMEEEKTKALEARKARTGTRLTMTSRSGYFADRIITPAMMRAMAILYLGMADPDFERDYYVSPILAPSTLLAQFPTILLTCGEKDPFVDDTVIFAGRVREAKRALKAQLQMEVAGKSTRFGEGLRMSVASPDNPKSRILYETEEDWIQMKIYEGWSHGYLQMAALMHEAREAIVDLGKWIDEAFILRGKKLPTPPTSSGRKAGAKSPIRTSPVSPSTTRRGSSSRRQKPDLGHVLASSETETEPEGLVMPSRRRRSPPPSFGSQTTETPSSSETIAVSATPVPSTPTPASTYKVGAKGLDEAELIRRRRAEAAVDRL
ncbi:alpha/beta-hydrolase [Serendipita vermifera]|nr:alpha/beta-hydrolase [Serendipita vermifera]